MAEESVTQSHYSLRWNNHQSHLLAAFGDLLQAGMLVDVTLVCNKRHVKAHRVVLSACSPMFENIFSDNPCEHPVIILKDYDGWEMQALIDFMYKGEVSVAQDQIQTLMKAADNLKVRGLTSDARIEDSNSIVNPTPSPSTSNEYENRHSYSNNYIKYPIVGAAMRTPTEQTSPFSPIPTSSYETPVKLPHMSRLSFPETLMPRTESQSPIPRRKQARPRRRSGDLSCPQDLSTANLPKPTSPSMQLEETAENLCVKRQEDKLPSIVKEEKSCTPELLIRSPELDLTTHSSNKEFRSSPVSIPAQPNMSLKQEIKNQSSISFPPLPAVPPLGMTPSHSKFLFPVFGLDAPLGLYPPGLEGCRNPIFDMTDTRTAALDTTMYAKKKMGRPKGQHSAPRGGPPRSWTNAELTEALQHVWNKKMTTSQASRIFGIPYNSLLMYVRGKYGKSLKLEKLRKDCIGEPNNSSTVDMLGNLGSNNNNNIPKPNDRESESLQPNTRPSSNESQPPTQHSMYNPFTHPFYNDFSAGFPILLSMNHFNLPLSGEKNRSDLPPYGQTPLNDEEMKLNQAKEIDDEHQSLPDIYRPPNLDDRRELVQQNGQN
ncbi:hypothetical protein ABEB36_010464 [Hypothenemus hampei]|uniref:Protein jim lovell n=1 Tax=Hypothenemus hampei TaxID=57062 RepID=A0ABD1EMR3_HYPHA